VDLHQAVDIRHNRRRWSTRPRTRASIFHKVIGYDMPVVFRHSSAPKKRATMALGCEEFRPRIEMKLAAAIRQEPIPRNT